MDSFRRRLLCSLVIASSVAIGAACAPSEQACSATDIVLGVTAASSVAAQAEQVEVVAYDESGEIGRTRKDLSSGALFPLEFGFRPHAGQSFRVSTEVRTRAPLRGGDATDPGLVFLASRDMSLSPVCSKTKQLLRADLQDTCIGVSCTQGLTCISGTCVSATSPADALMPYRASWATEPDACAGSDGGTPEAILGTGQTDYVPTAENSTQQVEAGPQGGHHLWIGVRTKGLHQRAATMTLNATVEGTNVSAPMQRTVFSLRTDEGGYCKLFGVRYQLDGGSAPISAFLGHPLRLSVELRDEAGLIAKDDLRIMVSDTISGN